MLYRNIKLVIDIVCYVIYTINIKERSYAMEKQTRDILLRNVPVEVAELIKKQAKENFRSMNNEIIAILQKGVK